MDTHAAHACKFSHGSGLLVYINGALMTAARVALRVNIAALELVRRLPIDELSAVGVCLAAAFNNEEENMNIAWAEVGSDTERQWREAERSWDRFSGGPYEAYEMEKQSEDSALQRSLRRLEEAERNRLCQRGFSHVAEWPAYHGNHLSASSDSSSLSRSDIGTYGNASLLSHEGASSGHVIAAAGLCYANSDRSGSLEDEDMELNAIQLKAILRAEHPPKAPSTTPSDYPLDFRANPRPSDSLDMKNIRGSWSPGKGTGPVMSSEEFEALPDYSDVEDDPDWPSAVDYASEMSEAVELGEVVLGRIR
ncbi:hypothetical protein E8E12_009076 [Didymella heteroderae]|uniref:Uncharacterized protein n=1 Tax=Didymella heteroderae TaxID=1769908 RepID=A0A9P5C6N3_9PLEO|nr:hypothetical protein E8E12_009076 [Didymella heteroderae]